MDGGGLRQMPAKALRRARREKHLSLERVEVPDPDRPGQTTHVTRNRRTDILLYERSQHRLSVGAYKVGRVIQYLFEMGEAVRLARSPWRQKVDAAPRIEPIISRALYDAKKRSLLHAWLARHLGPSGAALIRKILADGWDYTQYARQHGVDTREGRAFVANRFRLHLEQLAETWRTDPPRLFSNNDIPQGPSQ